MAKQASNTKTLKVKAPVTKTAQDDDEDAEQVQVSARPAASDDDDDDDDSETETARAHQAEVVNVEAEEDDNVKFSCHTTVDPSPTVGNYRFADNGVAVLERMKNYTMPRRVAEHLVDKKVGVIVE
jgi:hypothetical protein